MAERKIALDINRVEGTKPTPLEKARKPIVDWLKEDPITDPETSVRIRVISKNIDFFEELYSNPDALMRLVDPSQEFCKELLENREIVAECFTFNAASSNYKEVLGKSAPRAQESYNMIAQDLREIKEDDLERRSGSVNVRRQQHLIYDARSELRQVSGNRLIPGFIVGKFD
jgi:hypothetical protein